MTLALCGSGAAAEWTSGRHVLMVDGRERSFLLDVPPVLKPGAALVMVFHGFTGSAKDIRELSGFAPVAAKHGFVAVYPEGTHDSQGKSFFNVGYAFHHDQKVDDVRFARELAGRLVADLKLDAKAVFATGFSNGGDMSFYLASQQAPFVAAIAPVAGTMMHSWAKGFHPASPIPVFAVNTKDDKTTLWAGDMENRDGWGAYLGTEEVVALWVKELALEKSERTETAKGVLLKRWSTAKAGTEVRLYEVSEGGHHWPRHLREDKASTAEEIWRFFELHRGK